MDLLQCWLFFFKLCFPPFEFSLRLHSRTETQEYLIERLEVKFYLTTHYSIFLSVIASHFLKICLLIFLHLWLYACTSWEVRRRCWVPWDWSNSSCVVPSVGAGKQSRNPTGTVSNCWASPSPSNCSSNISCCYEDWTWRKRRFWFTEQNEACVWACEGLVKPSEGYSRGRARQNKSAAEGGWELAKGRCFKIYKVGFVVHRACFLLTCFCMGNLCFWLLLKESRSCWDGLKTRKFA